MAGARAFDADAAITYARENKSVKRWGEGRCAERTMNAVEHGLGLVPRTLGGRPNSAYQFAPLLTESRLTSMGSVNPGFVLKENVQQPQKGDVAIIEPIAEKRFTGPWRDPDKAFQAIAPHGHMAIFDGEVWISDHIQDGGLPTTRNQPYPNSDYRERKPRVRIFRHQSMEIGD